MVAHDQLWTAAELLGLDACSPDHNSGAPAHDFGALVYRGLVVEAKECRDFKVTSAAEMASTRSHRVARISLGAAC